MGDAAAVGAYNAFALAYDKLGSDAPVDGNACPSAIDSHNLFGDLTSGTQGATLEPGVYCITGVGLLTKQLTLNGPSNAVWVFKAASSLAPIGGSVVMAGGGQACNVYWRTGTAVSLDNTDFVGTILAGSAITFTGAGSSLVGRALAKTESVTMTGASITDTCSAQPGPGPGPEPRSCSDRVTGGGYIKVGHGNANFGVTGGIRKGAFRGHLTYIDHSTGMKVKGTGVTAYVVVDAKTRRIEGTAKINGVAGTYKVVVSDNGEPGKKKDSFNITLSSGYAASGTLAGGNIQLHKRNCHEDHKDHGGHDQGDDDHDDDHNDDGDHDDDDDNKRHGDSKKPYGRK